MQKASKHPKLRTKIIQIMVNDARK